MKTIAVVSPQAQFFNSDGTELGPIYIHGKSIYCALLDVPEPYFDSENDEYGELILVKKLAFSLNFRDIVLLFNSDYYLSNTTNLFEHFAVGSEFVGVVQETGHKVTGFFKGDRVIGNAAFPDSGYEYVQSGIPSNYASNEYEVFHHCKLMKIPALLTDEVAAGFMLGAQTSFSMIRKSKIGSDEKCLITSGSSNTSLFLIAALRRKKIRVVVLTTSTANADLLLDIGADRVVIIDHAQPLAQNEAFLLMTQEEKGFDVIFDPYCDVHIGQLLKYLNINGRYMTCGISNQYSAYVDQKASHRGDSENALMLLIICKNLSIIGNCLGSTQDLQQALEAYSTGAFHVIVDSVYNSSQVSAFFDRTYNNRNRLGKVIMKY